MRSGSWSRRLMAVVALCSAAAVAACGKSPSAGKVIEQAGFTPIVPPSALLAPGTIVKPFAPGQHGVEALIVCEASSALGGQQALASPSESGQLSGKLGGTFDLSANTMSQLKGDASLNAVEKVSVTFSNVSVREIPANRVAAATMSADCRRALAAVDGEATMVAEVLQADATYVVSFDASANLDASGQAMATRVAAAKLGAGESAAQGTTITGKALYWGVRLDAELLKLATGDK